MSYVVLCLYYPFSALYLTYAQHPRGTCALYRVK